MNKGSARRVRLRAVVAYPALSMALVASVSLIVAPFGPAQGTALAALPSPTSAPTGTPAGTSSPTATPSATSSSSSAPSSSPASTSIPVPTPVPAPAPSVTPSPGAVPVDHEVLARIEGTESQATYLAVDAPVLNASQFQNFRVRFQIHNAGAVPIQPTPRLEYRPVGGTGFVVVPEEPQKGIAFRVAREWVPSLGPGGGTKQGPLGEVIAAGDRRIGSEAGVAVSGHHSMGANPDRSITLPPASYTEQEFTVQLTIDAKYLTSYDLRITDRGAVLPGSHMARIALGASPAVQVSPGQRQGIIVDGPKDRSAASVAYPLLPTPSTVVGTRSMTAVQAVYRPNAARYPLASGDLSPATVALPSAATGAPDAIHGPYSITTDQCATCHRGHSAQAPNLLNKGSQSALCFTCHGPLGANTDVQAQYALAPPAHDPNDREFYSHDAVNSIPSTTPAGSELKYRDVTNRNIECADCHNSHKANANSDSTQIMDTQTPTLSTGWSASGRLEGVSGVSVENAAANSNPSPASYTFLDGVTKPVTLEYQLCFKCHSSFTTLLPKIADKPSTDELDKAREFNPQNASFHPIEAKGTNQTPKMQASLDGFSTYKLWNFQTTSTVRCLNCHANGAPPATPPPAAGGALAPHASSNRGILLENYQDRVLKSASVAYSSKDFALCYVCHGEDPFKTSSGSGATDATNFSLHGLHLTALNTKGDGGTDIDKLGAGEGNAICAECHFRIHSTTYAVGSQVAGSRLVNFAPNVDSLVPGGTPTWTSSGIGSGSCSLTCHGYSHARSYLPAQ